MQINKIMTEQVHCIPPETTLRDLRKIFSQVKYHHLLVTHENRLLGVISDRDVLRMSSPQLDDAELTEQDNELLARQAESFMSTQLVTAQTDTLIDAAAILLLENNISCLPVVDGQNQILGIVTWKDMLKYYVYVA